MKTCPTCTANNLDLAETCTQCNYVWQEIRSAKFPQDLITKIENVAPSSKSKWALGLGLFAIVLVLFTGICAPIPGLWASVIGYREIDAMKKENRYSKTGEQYCTAGIWAGWIATAMSILLLALGSIYSIWVYQWVKGTFIY